jgi:hypothetical protein
VNGLKDENLSPTRGGEGGSATPTESGEAERREWKRWPHLLGMKAI